MFYGRSEDMHTYMFQYYLWPESCSIRYTANSFFIICLAVFYQLILQNGI